MELSIFSAATALIAAAALTWLVLRFFFGMQKATAGAMDASGERQSATITVKGGYSPAVISMRTGTPITLTFDRQETGECTSHVVFADLGLDAMLPGNATTDVELPALPAGEYPFACGMNMVHGLLRVEGEESKDGADKDGLRPRADGSAEAEGVSPSDLRVGAPVVDAAEAERREAAERANEIKALTKLVIVGAVLTLPVFAVTMLHMANPALVPHWMVNPWLQAILITPVMFYCGRPIHTVGFPALAHRSPDMNSLVSLGTSAAYLYSLVTCIAPWVFPEGSREPYFESVGVVITLVLVGRLLEAKAREGTGKAVQSLIRLRPRTAHKLNATSADNVDGIEWRNPAHFTDTDIDAIVTGDLLIVKNGERVPTDGVIVAGEARIDESMITGESKPVSKTAGDPVTGATVLLKGDCVMRATQVGADTVLSQIAAMVARAQATKAPVQQLADKIARYFVPATPLSVTVSLGLGATNGVLVTSAKALEQARRIGTVVFDKTGTITRGVVDAAADWDKPSYEQDTVKEGSREAIAALRARGIRTVMLSGDKAEVAGRIAREVGIDTVICEVKPDGKAYWIAKLQRERDEATAKSAYGTSRTAAQSRTLIAMVGDGINDAPALAQADLGIAIGTGTDVAMQSADVTLMSGDLRGVIKTINLSNATMRNIRENLGWAFGYNVIGIPVAAGVLYPFTGWLLSPMIAGLAMALSSVCLVLNANRLHGANINVGVADGPAGSGSSMADVESAGSAESANAANITGSATSNAPHEPTVIIDDRTTLNQTNHVSDQSNNPTNKENTMDMGMHMHHTAPADGETATDPVCGMTVAVNADAITREYEGKSYYFCGEHCATNFMKAPQVFLEQ